ncbi:hypothetical protein GCM10023091_00160 [Ravibacter arvi]|uniref:NACHT domain-containing protein n=1 Tax=Ravibacter arvi TaxID=2051041 RepID=A0ABP8LJ12_9BACT
MVNWNIFESLPGSQEYNFEILSRSLVWLAYSRYGSFRAKLNQPGVEFDLKLDTECSLGKPAQHFGWQCRWYGIASGTDIGKTRRGKIKDALEKTIEDIHGLTDWVLWTRHTLTKSDQEWFYSLSDTIKLHLWSSHESEILLNTEAEQLKQTYFGELILRPEQLATLHEHSVAPIKKRWFPEVHQKVDAERSVLRMLGRTAAWDELTEVSTNIMALHKEMRLSIATVPAALKEMTGEFLSCMESYAEKLKVIFKMLDGGEFIHLKQSFPIELRQQLQQLAGLPRKLRGARLQIALIATNAMADLKEADRLLSKTKKFLETRLVGIVADAGCGKTQLSATLTTPQDSRPAGILLLGRFLKHGGSLDDLASRIVINGKPVSSMQGLLAALNSVGERAKCILPLVIDGLNEAEDPMEWKLHLSSLKVILDQYPNILVICTLRSGSRRGDRESDYEYDSEQAKRHPFVEQCLPDYTLTFEIPDFGDDIGDAMDRYFEHFKIEAQPNLVYNYFLRHPLTLRIFCEVCNPTREKPVGMEAVPRSLASLFEKYVELAAARIEELSPYHCRYRQADITAYLDKFGQALWETHSREVPQEQFREDIKDRSNWDNSAVNFMEQEGLLLRMPGNLPYQYQITPTYDLLGGYLIAKYIISKNGRDTIESWIKNETTAKALDNNYETQHPLRDDIIWFLTALLPQYHHIQFWEVVDNNLRDEALELAILLEPKYLDTQTTVAVAESIKKSEPNLNKYLGRLYPIRVTERHPLNVLFVDQVLSSLEVGKRDLIWSEWLRRNQPRFESDLDGIISTWSAEVQKRIPTDNLMARWIMWMLTSTSHRMRHKATLALYWYGRGAAKQLFDLAISSLSVNDPYIPERMLAASYGAAMARACDPDNSEFCNDVLPNFARQIYELMFSLNAESLSTHILILDYARGIIELAESRNAALFSPEELNEIYKTPKPSQGDKSIRKYHKETERGQSPFRMDFENYVIGRLVPGRRNYDYGHEGYKDVRSKILWRIFDLGWSFKAFETVERSIENVRNSYRHEDSDIDKTDRYGKKYSWIAYFEQKGLIEQSNEEDEDIYLDRRESDADIDPSFPYPLRADRIIDMDTLGSPDIPPQEWVKSGEIPDLGIYLQQETLGGLSGPWVLLDGHLGQKDERRGRSMFGFFRAFFVAKDQQAELVSLLEKQRLGGRWLPEKYEESCAFAGEVPWSSHFADQQPNELRFVVAEITVEEPEEVDRFYLNEIAVELSFFDKLRLSVIDFSSDEDDERLELSDEDFGKLEIRKETVMVKRVQQQTRDITVIQPVCDLGTPGKTLFEEFTGGSTLNKKLIQMLDLTTIPQGRDLRNSSSEQVTFQNFYAKNSSKNNERLFFLRKDLLDSLLDQLGMSLVWAVWGERKLSLGQFEMWDRRNPGEDQAYADFQQIHVYS